MSVGEWVCRCCGTYNRCGKYCCKCGKRIQKDQEDEG